MFGVMQFMTLPPEVTSALIHSGPGAQSLVEAATAWRQLAAKLDEFAESYVAVVSSLTGTWYGPSATAMVRAVDPYLTWLRTTAQQCQRVASSAQTAAAAFNSARATMVSVAQVAANRARLAQLLATNGFGRNLPAIADNEYQYQSMWANNSAAMSRYQATSAHATALPEFTSPPSVSDPTGLVAQAGVAPTASTAAAASTAASLASFDPQSGWFGLANTYANQFISSGFPINLLSYLAQNTSAQALQTVGSQIGQGLSEGEAALGPLRGSGAFGAAGLSAEPTAAIGVGVSMGKLTAPPAVVGLLPGAQSPVQLASAASPLASGEPGLPMPPILPPPISAGSGWRKRKQQKYEDLEYGLEIKGAVMPRPPSAG
ncbi:PPE family protein [Mycobacterium heckeshornense]|uniref:PPE family protein n=2 Tax=Mycobacterium heckeshornense TaxID=110505 RepID=A0A7R7GXA5_9MYCO|nr:PPE family protein [Mycobacterium heckeshornense]